MTGIPNDFILFIVAQAIIGIGAIVKLYFDVQNMKIKIKNIEEEKKAILEKLAEMSEHLAVIKSHFELGTLTKLKTHVK